MKTSESNPLFENYPHLFKQKKSTTPPGRSVPTIDDAIKGKEAEYEEEIELYKIYGGD